MDKQIDIRIADWEHQRHNLSSIRTAVFIDEQGVPAELEWDESDSTAMHLLAWYSTYGAVGCARLLGNGQIGRMAVLPPFRNLGIGAALLRKILSLAEQQGLQHVFLHAQTSARGFYERAGFIASGDEYLEAGIPHISMEKQLL